jgi:hypothetical protein
MCYMVVVMAIYFTCCDSSGFIPCTGGDGDCPDGMRCNGYQLMGCNYQGERGLGEYCYSEWFCAPGLVCNTSYQLSQCRPPDSSNRNEPCRYDDDCLPGLGLVCHQADVGTCGPRSGRGEDCTRNTDCVEGLVCRPETPSPKNRWSLALACGDLNDKGGPCGEDGHCREGLKCTSLVCGK